MGMTPEQMDQLVDEHFGFEATDDIDGVMATLSADARHEVIPSPVGELNEPSKMRSYYEIRDGEITREQAWCDLAAIQQRLGCTSS